MSIKTVNGEIAGFCLWYPSRSDAISFFDFLHRYLSASSKIPRHLLKVQATKERSGNYLFTIIFGLEDTVRQIEIKDVAKEHIYNIQESLAIFSHFLLAAGHNETGNDNPVLLPLKNYHLLISRIIVDGVEYTGNPKGTIPLEQILQTNIIYYA